MYIYTRLHTPARPGVGGWAESSANSPSGREDLTRLASAVGGSRVPGARRVEAKKGLAWHAGHQAGVGEAGVTSPHPGLAL